MEDRTRVNARALRNPSASVSGSGGTERYRSRQTPSESRPTTTSDAATEAKKRLNPIKRKQLEERVHELEEAIGRTESAISELETALQNFVSTDENQRQSRELDQHKASHAALIREWEDLAETLQGSD